MGEVDNVAQSPPYTVRITGGLIFGLKSYVSATLQFRIANHHALMAQYDYLNYNKFNSLIDHPSEEYLDQFKAIAQDG